MRKMPSCCCARFTDSAVGRENAHCFTFPFRVSGGMLAPQVNGGNDVVRVHALVSAMRMVFVCPCSQQASLCAWRLMHPSTLCHTGPNTQKLRQLRGRFMKKLIIATSFCLVASGAFAVDGVSSSVAAGTSTTTTTSAAAAGAAGAGGAGFAAGTTALIAVGAAAAIGVAVAVAVSSNDNSTPATATSGTR